MRIWREKRYMTNLRSIIKGWKNYIGSDSVGLATAEKRAKICAACDEITSGKILMILPDEVKEIQGMKCGKCQCPLSAKTRSLNETCPLKKW